MEDLIVSPFLRNLAHTAYPHPSISNLSLAVREKDTKTKKLNKFWIGSVMYCSVYATGLIVLFSRIFLHVQPLLIDFLPIPVQGFFPWKIIEQCSCLVFLGSNLLKNDFLSVCLPVLSAACFSVLSVLSDSSVCFAVLPFVSVCLSVCLRHSSVCLSACLSFCLPFCLPDCLSALMFVCLSVISVSKYTISTVES